MIHKKLLDFIDSDTPALNPLLANGIAVEQLKHADKYLDSVFESAFSSNTDGFLPGVEYDTYKRDTSLAVFHRLTQKRKNNKRNFDIARNDLYTNLYMIKFEGEPLPPRPIQLPFLTDSPLFTLRDSVFSISPVLNDIVFSLLKDGVFVRLLRDLINFERFQHTFVTSEGKNETVSVVWAAIHKMLVKNSKKSRPSRTTLVHYLLAKYGFKETFQSLTGYVPVVGTNEINVDTYPIDKWVICQPTGDYPMRRVRHGWRASNIRIAVPKEHYTPMMKNMLGGLFYVLDLFPDRIQVKWFDDQRLWRKLLGVLIFPPNTNEGLIADNVDEHIRSLDDYMDSFNIQQLKELGFEVTNIYQLMGLLIEHLNEWIVVWGDKINSMYDKELNVLYFLLLSITKGIFYSVYALVQRYNNRKVLTAKDVNEILDRNLKPNLIFSVTRDQTCVQAASVSNDNKALRLTANLVPQSSNEVRRAKKVSIDDPATRLHVSVAEVGGYTFLPKSAPDGRQRLNLCLKVDEFYRIMRNPKFNELLDDVQKRIS